MRLADPRGARGARRGTRPAPCCPPVPVAVDGRERSPVARVALVGNPNVGKSTLFNGLTGAHQQVGNWPGKTVQVASGWWPTPAGLLELTDLPGTYSLVARSPDEELVRDLVVGHAEPSNLDLVVAVLDATNLMRNLYLLAQLLDTGIPLVVALTMTDVATVRGLRVDVERLSDQLGLPVVEVRPRSRAGLDRLARAVADVSGSQNPRPVRLDAATETAIAERVRQVIDDRGTRPANARWLAINSLTANPTDGGMADPAPGEDLDTLIADQRYAWARGVVAASTERPEQERPTLSDRLDGVLTSRWLGLPIFLLIMWGVFVATTRAAAPLQGGLSALVDGPVLGATRWLLRRSGLSDSWFSTLICDGLVRGVGQLLTFVPLMLIMFVLLAVLEDSGYTARAAFVADRLLRMVGLPGHAFLPLIIGFGCNVPAVAGTRILGDARHRLMTVLLVPFVTCSARLSVYVLLANVFFGRDAGTVVFAMYLISIGLVLLVGVGLRHTLLRGQPRGALVLELPPYHRPSLPVVARQTWQRLSGFLRTAAGIIVGTVTLVWLLTAIPLANGSFGKVDAPDSLYAGVSRAVSTVFAPAGFADWHATGALVTGFVAKEAVVSTFAQTYHVPEPADARGAGGLDAQLRATFDRASGGHPTAAVLAFLVFILAYTPCMATVAAQRAEVGRRWTWIGIGLQLTVAWTLATAVFQIGRLLT